MGSSPDVPTVPQPTDVATQQQALNLDALKTGQAATLINQSNPYGTMSWTQTGTDASGAPQYSGTQTLSAGQQRIFDARQRAQQMAGQTANQLFSNTQSQYTKAPDFSQATDSLTSDLLKKQQTYMQPYFDTQTSSLDTQLRNQGMKPGDPGYDTAMMKVRDDQTREMTGYLGTVQPQAYAQAVQNYMLPAQLAQQFSNFSNPNSDVKNSLIQTPQFNMQPANLVGATASANDANMAAYNAQVNQNNAMMSGLFGIGTAGIGAMTGNPMMAMGGLGRAFGGGVSGGGLGYSSGGSLPSGSA